MYDSILKAGAGELVPGIPAVQGELLRFSFEGAAAAAPSAGALTHGMPRISFVFVSISRFTTILYVVCSFTVFFTYRHILPDYAALRVLR